MENGIDAMNNDLGAMIISLRTELSSDTETHEGTEPNIQLRKEALKKVSSLYTKTKSKELFELIDETYRFNAVPEVRAEAGKTLGYSKRQIWVNNNKGEAASILCFAGIAAAYVLSKVYNSEAFLDKADKLANLILNM